MRGVAANMLSKISFSLYLTHVPILTIVWLYLIQPMQFSRYWMQAIAELVIGTVASVVVAGIFYKLIEKPCHLWSKSIKKVVKL